MKNMRKKANISSVPTLITLMVQNIDRQSRFDGQGLRSDSKQVSMDLYFKP